MNLYLQKRGKARQKLADKGIGSKLDAYTAPQDLVEHQQELQVQQGRLAGFGSRKAISPEARARACARARETTKIPSLRTPAGRT